RAGFEPATNRLTAGCSTAELPGNGGLGVSASAPLKLGAVYNNPYRICQVRNSSFCTFLPKPGKGRAKTGRWRGRRGRQPAFRARFSESAYCGARPAGEKRPMLPNSWSHTEMSRPRVGVLSLEA